MRLLLAMLCLLGGHQSGPAVSLEELTSRFRAYRVELGREAAGAPPELRRWDGPVHRVWTEVGARLGDGTYTERRVVELLGAPEEIYYGEGRHATVHVPAGETHLVYWWRGGHDYLYFVVREGRVVDDRWWFAGE